MDDGRSFLSSPSSGRLSWTCNLCDSSQYSSVRRSRHYNIFFPIWLTQVIPRNFSKSTFLVSKIYLASPSWVAYMAWWPTTTDDLPVAAAASRPSPSVAPPPRMVWRRLLRPPSFCRPCTPCLTKSSVDSARPPSVSWRPQTPLRRWQTPISEGFIDEFETIIYSAACTTGL